MARLNRFTCAKCGRRYEVPPALTGLPLLCKGCGLPLTVPDPPDEPEPEPPPPPPRPKPPVARPAEPPAPPKPAAPQPPADEDDEPYLIAEPDGSPDIDFDMPGPTASSRGDTHRSFSAATPGPGHESRRTPPPAAKPAPKPATRESPAAPAPARRSAGGIRVLIALVADVAVGLVLLAGAVFLGEVVARKPTRQVWNEAGGAVSFPPVDLMLWAGPPVLVVLVYVLLASRGWTVGGWLKRRAA